ncbi:hypothetical protein PBRA_009679 [Plasmodiophora brassicae]|uniref:Uncharacterized protein n=1 Tax=Plasmodiophora brassicae TaxID=37360 RepID=A0A0G4IKA2_PLABS|nr:hypothetical protein PBRA_009679 [Plasmodiophora brassicae]
MATFPAPSPLLPRTLPPTGSGALRPRRRNLRQERRSFGASAVDELVDNGVQQRMRPLTTSQEDVVRQRVGEALARMGLRFSAHGGQLTGNRVLKQNSHKQYKQLYRQLALFCKRIGDFESLIILDERAPTEFCPSMSADTLMCDISQSSIETLSSKRSSNSDLFLARWSANLQCVSGVRHGLRSPRSILGTHDWALWDC